MIPGDLVAQRGQCIPHASLQPRLLPSRRVRNVPSSLLPLVVRGVVVRVLVGGRGGARGRGPLGRRRATSTHDPRQDSGLLSHSAPGAAVVRVRPAVGGYDRPLLMMRLHASAWRPSSSP